MLVLQAPRSLPRSAAAECKVQAGVVVGRTARAPGHSWGAVGLSGVGCADRVPERNVLPVHRGEMYIYIPNCNFGARGVYFITDNGNVYV